MKRAIKSYFIGITGLICGVSAFIIYDEINRHKTLIQEGTYPIVNSVIGYALLALVLGAVGLVFGIKTLRYYTVGKSKPEELIDMHQGLFNNRRALQLNPLIWLLALCFILAFIGISIFTAASLYQSISVTTEPGFSGADMWRMYRPQVLIIFFLFASAIGMLVDYLNLWIASRKK
ncbi:MAG: hypothetical protein ABR574_08500 [Cryomorphaceae bacterium]|nr:hypothetical protein [Flavobacteriales bacterium]